MPVVNCIKKRCLTSVGTRGIASLNGLLFGEMLPLREAIAAIVCHRCSHNAKRGELRVNSANSMR